MAFQEGTEEITCPHCGTVHSVSWFRMPVRERHRLTCQTCGKVMKEGKGVLEYDTPRKLSD